MRVGVTGANGMLGCDLVPVLRNRGHEVVPWDWEDYDVCDPAKVAAVIAKTYPDLIIHTAAYTDVDKAEGEPDLVMNVNGGGTRNVAMACRDCGIPMFYMSTDYNFDGTKGRPHVPEDSPNPINVYGQTKLAGEQAIVDLLDDYCIVRTSWLYGLHGQNFVHTILRLAQESPELRVVNDQIGCPTWTGTLARALADLVDLGGKGTYHVTDACEGISWYDFAVAILETVGINVCVKPVATTDFPRPARRPPYSVLDLKRTETALRRPLPPWRHSLECMLGLANPNQIL